MTRVTVSKLVNKRFANIEHYQNHCIIKNLARYNADVANDLKKITKKTGV